MNAEGDKQLKRGERQGDRRTGLLARVICFVLVMFYRARGWVAVGEVPVDRRFIIIAAPHTSNWDFVNYLGLVTDIGLRTHFMAKSSLFKGMFGRFIAQMGGIPVDRRASHNYVQAMADEFAQREEFILTIAPEGTRRKTKQWRTGFYQIALMARVPIVVGLMDYKHKRGGLGPLFWPTGDFRSDMVKVLEIYCECTPKHAERAIKTIEDICGDQEERQGPARQEAQ